MSELSVVEVQRLEALESVINAGMQTFVHVGNALLEIRDNRLYRRTHRTFKEYCRERWEFSKSHAERLISAAEVVEVLKMSPMGDILPTVERQARPLTSLPPEQQPAVWQRAVETAPNGKITQAHVQAVVDKHREEERTSADEYYDEEDDQDSDYVYQGGLARCKYCWKIHDKWELSADTPPSVRWVCEYCDHATADANMDLRQPEPDDNAAATHTPDVDDEHQEEDDEYLNEEVVQKQNDIDMNVHGITSKSLTIDEEPRRYSLTASNHAVSSNPDYDGDEWYTPMEYIEAARKVMGTIDLDPASSQSAQQIIRAARYYTKHENSLKNDVLWHGHVWMNPPYSTPLIGYFIDKLLLEYGEGRVSQAIVLTNNSSDTQWFHKLLARFPACFTRGRVQFWRPDSTTFGARQGQTFFYLGHNVSKFQMVFESFGIVVVKA